jgi:hypothetical protein
VPDEKWKNINLKELGALEAKYGALLNEIADSEAIDANLTHPVPPFLLTDLRPVLLHPDVPRATNVIQKFEEEDEAEYIDAGDGIMLEAESEDGAQGGGAFGGGMNRSGGSFGGSNRGSYSGSGGMSRPPGGGMSRPPGGSMSPPGGGMSRPGGGASMGFGGGSMNLDTYRPVAKKLVRYVDFTAQTGHKYRYRVMLVLEDPNRPRDPNPDPDPTTLDVTVLDRIKKEEAEGRQRYLTTAWSAPSAVVSMSSSERFYAGETVPSPTVNIGGATIPISEPQAKVLTVTWDPALRAFVPAEQSVHRASVLNVKADVEVIHPVQGDLRKVDDHEVTTNGVVLDILGGERLPAIENSKEIVRAPGETLIMDADGNLVVTDEARDIEGYRRYIFPEPKPDPKEKSKSDDEDSAGPMPGGASSMGPPPGGGSGKGPPGGGQGYPGSKKGKMPKAGRR